jgi:hypothetical protein
VKESKKLSNEISDLAESIDKFKGRILLEDWSGYRSRIVRIRVVGTNTDDPGIVLKLEVMHD